MRPEFAQIPIFFDRLNNATRPRPAFQHQNVLSGLLQRVSAAKARNSRANDNCKWTVSHGSERFREERLGVQVLFFEIGVENHRQVADKNAAEPGSANFVLIHR